MDASDFSEGKDDGFALYSVNGMALPLTIFAEPGVFGIAMAAMV